ncbi:MAG: HAMP domain-containing protein [Bacteroidales bacterium]|nr:HAMP domain-containing protein [Bacteroidales bacterium]
MKIKTKLTLGVGLLFLLIILLGVLSENYTQLLKSNIENVLSENYNTLEYTRDMLIALGNDDAASLQRFESDLRKQETNITEKGEQAATFALRNYFNEYKLTHSKDLLPKMRKTILDIMEMNMRAIQRKSEIAKHTAHTATFWIAIASISCFVIAIVLQINLPGNIANPIKELTESIKRIAAKDYSQRVHFVSNSEFGELALSFNTMAQKLEEYNNSSLARLMMEKKRIETIVNNMKDPVIGLDENMRIIFVNDFAANIIGLQQYDLLDKPVSVLSAKNDLIRNLTADLISPAQINSKEKSKPIRIFANGKEGYFEKEIVAISAVPTGETNKVLIGYVIILRNITEYKALDTAKTNFIANVSHEFKTPISSIKMSIQLLENEKIGVLNEDQKSLLESIKEDAGQLLKITSELLNMTQVESGNIQLSILSADPKEMLTYAINANKILADQMKIKFKIDVPENLPQVYADREKTAWVLTNLISNAIRYSYDNSTVYLSITPKEKQVEFAVKDTGKGIDPKYKEKIFDRYFRVPGTSKEGTGLGLAISKEFIEAQDGQIKVESELGAGSTFTIALNRA